jgi:Protein of unknown function (DUF2752)
MIDVTQVTPRAVRTEPQPVKRPVIAPLVAGVALVMGCAVVGIVDPRGGPTICPFKLATGLDCPGCGGTRAAHDLMRGDLIGALDHNVLAVIAIPLILWGLFTWLTSALGGPKLRTFSPSTRWTVVAVVVLVAFWVVRNLSFAPFHWLYSGT